jgi:hypothetical protein
MADNIARDCSNLQVATTVLLNIKGADIGHAEALGSYVEMINLLIMSQAATPAHPWLWATLAARFNASATDYLDSMEGEEDDDETNLKTKGAHALLMGMQLVMAYHAPVEYEGVEVEVRGPADLEAGAHAFHDYVVKLRSQKEEFETEWVTGFQLTMEALHQLRDLEATYRGES